MRITITVLLLLFVVSACTTTVKYDVLQKTSQYQLTQEKPIPRQFKLYAIESLIPVEATNELIINTFAGAEIVDGDGKPKATYNRQVGGQSNSAAMLQAYRKVGNFVILAYTDHVATLDADYQLLSKLDKPGTMQRSHTASVSPNGLLALAFGFLWDLASNNKLEYFNLDEAQRDEIISADFSSDNRYLVLTLDLLSESKVQLWDLQKWVVINSWMLGGYANVKFSPDGKRVIFNIVQRPHSIIKAPTLSVYNIDTATKAGDIVFATPTSIQPVIIDDDVIVSGHRNGDIHVWSYRNFTALHNFHGESEVTAITKDTAGRVWCGFADGKLIVFENGQFSLVHTFTNRVTHLAALGNQLFVEVFAQPNEQLATYTISRVAN